MFKNKINNLVLILLFFLPFFHLRAQSHGDDHYNEITKFYTSKRKAKQLLESKNNLNNSSNKLEGLIETSSSNNGLFETYLSPNFELYFAIPDSLFNKCFLLSNRVSATSNPEYFAAGQMITDPIIIKFTKDGRNVYLHEVNTSTYVAPTSRLLPSYQKNYVDPILNVFPIKEVFEDKSLIDVTSFFTGDEIKISPTPTNSPLPSSPISEANRITQVKSFPLNIEVKSLMAFRAEQLYTVEVHRSLILLPDEPMQPRMYDDRIGFFYSAKTQYDHRGKTINKFNVIHRWKVEPKDTLDIDEYFSGKTIEVKKPIIFYIDTVFPKEWIPSIKEGVCDWNKAFERAGFKEAIQVKEYPSPSQDPNFDPDDLRFSCIKYALTETANAFGPNYIDPRSGEILNADIIWHHNVISLLNKWRFFQTAGADPRVRQPHIPDSLLAESIKYIISHEVGHTLGLTHNMGASFTYPVDSLRSPNFTTRHGLSPSIMDYCRFNYVAQPEDVKNGVKLISSIGEYDEFAINWGYRLLPPSLTFQERNKILKSWLDAKNNDPVYQYKPQQATIIDYTAQPEDLGNDHIYASSLGIKNLKRIMTNYETWLENKGTNIDALSKIQDGIATQYLTYLNHVLPYLGGVAYQNNRQGDNKDAYIYVPKSKQEDALAWLDKEVRSYREWLFPDSLYLKYGRRNSLYFLLPKLYAGEVLSAFRLSFVADSYLKNPTLNFSPQEYMSLVIKTLFKSSFLGLPLRDIDKEIEDYTLNYLLNQLNISLQSSDGSLYNINGIHSFPNCYSYNNETGFTYNFSLPSLPDNEVKPMYFKILNDIYSLYQKRVATCKYTESLDFYNYWLFKLNKILNK